MKDSDGNTRIHEGKEAVKFMEREDASVSRGEVNCHYWSNGHAAVESRVVFDGEYVHKQMLEYQQGIRPNRPTHLMPLVNHCDENDSRLNCKPVFMKSPRRIVGDGTRNALVYVSKRDIEAGEFLRIAYRSRNRGTMTSRDRADEDGMAYANKR